MSKGPGIHVFGLDILRYCILLVRDLGYMCLVLTCWTWDKWATCVIFQVVLEIDEGC